MSAVSDARDQLYGSLVALIQEPGRVHRVTPNRVDSPCAFLGGASLVREFVGNPGVSVVVVTFPVYLVADGTPSAQTEALDEMVCWVWDAAFRIGAQPQDARPAAIDVGGPSLRGAVVSVDMTIRALTLCAPILEGTTTHG